VEKLRILAHSQKRKKLKGGVGTGEKKTLQIEYSLGNITRRTAERARKPLSRKSSPTKVMGKISPLSHSSTKGFVRKNFSYRTNFSPARVQPERRRGAWGWGGGEP